MPRTTRVVGQQRRLGVAGTYLYTPTCVCCVVCGVHNCYSAAGRRRLKRRARYFPLTCFATCVRPSTYLFFFFFQLTLVMRSSLFLSLSDVGAKVTHLITPRVMPAQQVREGGDDSG